MRQQPEAPHPIIPPYLLARGTASVLRAACAACANVGSLVAEIGPTPDRTIYDAQGRERLPGVRVRREEDPPTGDQAVDEAFDGLGATFDLFWDAFGRNGIDAAGGPMRATVHFGEDYDNAFWNGEQMVFGDGDGEVFVGFTGSLSVIAHELAHGVTQHEAALVYEGQSGALNESISDVFGALAEQHDAGQTVDQATWLIGAGIFTDAVQGKALRSMAAPGTAYDDDVLGRDPQPDHMDRFVVTEEDNGGVHINSGIPNRAFHLAATTLGGHAWERAGLIWYRTLTSGTLSTTTDFTTFARATLTAAAAEYGEGSEEVDAVRDGWKGVGVL